MATQTKTRRTRVTRQDIEKAKEELAQAPKNISPRTKTREKSQYGKSFWYGEVYCDSNGWASIAGKTSPEGAFEGVWLGKTDEIIPYLKSRRINGEDVDIVLQAANEFRSEKKSQSCHLATKNGTGHISIPPAKPNRATFKNDPRFLRLLDSLIAEGCGLPTIQKRIKENGYDVAYRTLGRYIKVRRAS